MPRRAVACKLEFALEPLPALRGRLQFDHFRIPRRKQRLTVPELQRDPRLLAQCALEAAADRAAQRTEHVFPAQRIELGTVSDSHRGPTMQASTHSRRFTMPRRTQVFTVPRGLRRCAARWPWLKPWWYAS